MNIQSNRLKSQKPKLRKCWCLGCDRVYRSSHIKCWYCGWKDPKRSRHKRELNGYEERR